MPLLLLLNKAFEFFAIFARVKSIRSISPFISIVLMILVMSGSFGFTLIHHACQHCGTDEIIATVSGSLDEDSCCTHDTVALKPNPGAGAITAAESCCPNEEGNHRHSFSKMAISNDCCSHQAERVVTGELVRSQVQNEIMPYFLAATIVAVIHDNYQKRPRLNFDDNLFTCGRDLTTLHCQIIS